MSQSREVLLTTVNDILYLVRQVSAEALDVNTERLPHIVYEDLDFNANRDQEWILRNQDGKTIIVIDPSVAHEGVRSLLSDENFTSGIPDDFRRVIGKSHDVAEGTSLLYSAVVLYDLLTRGESKRELTDFQRADIVQTSLIRYLGKIGFREQFPID